MCPRTRTPHAPFDKGHIPGLENARPPSGQRSTFVQQVERLAGDMARTM
jgi:hypothetical protein